MHNTNDLIGEMSNEIFLGVSLRARANCESDEEVDMVVDLTLKNLLQFEGSIYDDGVIDSEIKLKQIMEAMLLDVKNFDGTLLDVYLKVVGRGGKFELTMGTKKLFEVYFEMYGVDYREIAGEYDKEVEWNYVGTKTVEAYSKDHAESIVISDIESQQTDYEDYSISRVEERGEMYE